VRTTSLPTLSIVPLPISAQKSRRVLILAAAMTAFLAIPKVGWADSCPAIISLNPQVTCTVPESNNELPMTVSMRYLSFTSQAQGVVLIYDDAAHTVLSDVVTFENLNGMATAVFASGTNLTVPPNEPVIGTYTEGQGFILLSLGLTDGKVLHAGICTDPNDRGNCNGGNDSLKLSVGNAAVPEPETFFLLGTGVVGIAIGSWRKRLIGYLKG
jgi:hypothetical protein